MLNTVAYNDCWFYFELFKCCHFFRSGLQEMQNVYERWLSCSEDWAKSSWAVSLTTKSKEKKRGARRWMTRAQISKKYESDEKMKPEFAHQREEHPDVPWRKEPYLKTVNQPSFVAPISKNPIKVSAHTHTHEWLNSCSPDWVDLIAQLSWINLSSDRSRHITFHRI